MIRMLLRADEGTGKFYTVVVNKESTFLEDNLVTSV